MLFQHYHSSLLLLLSLVLWGALACQPERTSVGAEPPQPTDTTPATSPEPPDPVPAFVEAFVAGLDARLRGIAVEKDTLRALNREARRVVAQANDRFLYRSILRRLYVRADPPHMVFGRGGVIDEPTRTLLSYLESMEHHGLDIRDEYHTEVIRREIKALDGLEDAFHTQGQPVELSVAEREMLLRLVREHHEAGTLNLEHTEAAADQLVRQLTAPRGPNEPAPIAAIAKRLKRHRRAYPRRNG
ncbi:MAG: hypothetical protein AAFS10_13585 [Myxococcota bacterium]